MFWGNGLWFIVQGFGFRVNGLCVGERCERAYFKSLSSLAIYGRDLFFTGMLSSKPPALVKDSQT